MDQVRWDERPQLRQPLLFAAFEGWNDAADAASSAVKSSATGGGVVTEVCWLGGVIEERLP